MSRLEFLRRTKGLSQGSLGDRIYYSGSAICRLERNRPNPATVGRRLRVALEGFFGEPLEHLLTEVQSGVSL